MEQITRIGMDTSKHVFQLHGVNAAEEPILRKKLRRKEMVEFFGKLPPTVVAIEACGGSHHWARELQLLGHVVKMLPPQYVKPYVKRGKNDAADAEALCEAMSRPTMRCVPVKTAEQQAALMLVGMRDRLVRNRTQLANAIRGYAVELGLTAAKGMRHIAPLLDRIAADEGLPKMARDLFALHAREFAHMQAEIEKVETRLMAWHRADECSRRLAQISANIHCPPPAQTASPGWRRKRRAAAELSRASFLLPRPLRMPGSGAAASRHDVPPYVRERGRQMTCRLARYRRLARRQDRFGSVGLALR